MDKDGTDPEGTKILTVWTAPNGGFHIDSLTTELADPTEWGKALADVALHLANTALRAGLVVIDSDENPEDGVEVQAEQFLTRLMGGLEERLENPPRYTYRGSRPPEDSDSDDG